MKKILLTLTILFSLNALAVLSDADKLAIVVIGGTNLNATYTCSVPNCTELIHIIKNGCPNESAAVVEARKLGAIMSTTIQYIKDHPEVIQ